MSAFRTAPTRTSDIPPLIARLARAALEAAAIGAFVLMVQIWADALVGS